jgi:uncharacterized membrane protein YdjX (TVP38/TMEM64 family)
MKKNFAFASILTIYMAIAPAIGSSTLSIWVIQNENKIQQFELFDWFIITLLFVITSAIAITPPTLLAFIFGYFLAWSALVPLISLNLLAIMSVYWAMQFFDKQSIYAFFIAYPRTKSFFERIQTNQFQFVFFTKLSPILPFALTNILFAAANLRPKNILIGGFLGMIPRTLLAIWIGHEAQHIKKLIEAPNDDPTSRIILLVLLLVSVWGVLSVFKNKT